MVKNVLCDLDGTLLRMKQDEFMKEYFQSLAEKFVPLGYDKDTLLKAVWDASRAMVNNNGEMTNEQRFWNSFTEIMGEDARDLIPVFKEYYQNEFDSIKKIVEESDIQVKVINKLKGKGYRVILATNPLFPIEAIRTRLKWAGLKVTDFDYITSYDESSYCKPNPEYFREIAEKVGIFPRECMMLGNNVIEDVTAKEVGMKVYIVTDFLENEKNVDYTQYMHGTMEEFLKHINHMPNVNQ
ncbi:MAG: HAD family hydrolase [Candidatus Limousia pullorum]